MATSIAIILELHMGMHMQLFHAKSEINTNGRIFKCYAYIVHPYNVHPLSTYDESFSFHD